LHPAGIGVFQEYYQRDLLSDYSESTVSWIPSLQIFFILGMVRMLEPTHPASLHLLNFVDRDR
jgi:hypothetical protein